MSMAKRYLVVHNWGTYASGSTPSEAFENYKVGVDEYANIDDLQFYEIDPSTAIRFKQILVKADDVHLLS